MFFFFKKDLKAKLNIQPENLSPQDICNRILPIVDSV